MNTNEIRQEEVEAVGSDLAWEASQGRKIPLWMVEELDDRLTEKLRAGLSAEQEALLDSLLVVRSMGDELRMTGELQTMSAVGLYQDLIPALAMTGENEGF